MNRLPVVLAGLSLLLAPRARAEGDPLDQTSRAPKFHVGPIVIGEDHPLFELADFPPAVEGDGNVQARWVESSVKWLRAADELAIPLARLRIEVKVPAERAIVRWRGRGVLFQGDPQGAFAEIFVPLLDISEARVDIDGKPAARVRIAAREAKATPPESRHAIDHSCSPYMISVAGLDDAFLSMNCKLVPVGRIGAEETFLNVHWAAAGITLADGSLPPLSLQLRSGHPARLSVRGPDGKPRTIEISAAMEPRWHRLRLAMGLGPYTLDTTAPTGNGWAEAAMLYANFRLRHDDDLSIRAFESIVTQTPGSGAVFNNLGLYFAYGLADVWDERLRMIALLGSQAVSYSDRGLGRGMHHESLIPQGFEVTYIDAFGIRNNRFTIGGLFELNKAKVYKNYWIRVGRRVFGEVNLISWSSGNRSAYMAGFSLGFPLAQFF